MIDEGKYTVFTRPTKHFVIIPERDYLRDELKRLRKVEDVGFDLYAKRNNAVAVIPSEMKGVSSVFEIRTSKGEKENQVSLQLKVSLLPVDWSKGVETLAQSKGKLEFKEVSDIAAVGGISCMLFLEAVAGGKTGNIYIESLSKNSPTTLYCPETKIGKDEITVKFKGTVCKIEKRSAMDDLAVTFQNDKKYSLFVAKQDFMSQEDAPEESKNMYPRSGNFYIDMTYAPSSTDKILAKLKRKSED
jgi:hypothetical protein